MCVFVVLQIRQDVTLEITRVALILIRTHESGNFFFASLRFLWDGIDEDIFSQKDERITILVCFKLSILGHFLVFRVFRCMFDNFKSSSVFGATSRFKFDMFLTLVEIARLIFVDRRGQPNNLKVDYDVRVEIQNSLWLQNVQIENREKDLKQFGTFQKCNNISLLHQGAASVNEPEGERERLTRSV